LAARDAAGWRNEAHQRERRHALPAPRLADQPQHAPAVQREADPVDGACVAGFGGEDHAEVANLEERHQPVTADSSGSTRGAEGGEKSEASRGTFRSTESYASRAEEPTLGAATSSPCGNPSW